MKINSIRKYRIAKFKSYWDDSSRFSLFCLFTKWLHVARNVAWVRKTFFCNERIKNVASNVNVNKATHCVRDYEYPLKSTWQLYWSCKNLINLSTILKLQKCYQPVNYTEAAKMLFILHPRKVKRNYLTFLWKVKNFS